MYGVFGIKTARYSLTLKTADLSEKKLTWQLFIAHFSAHRPKWSELEIGFGLKAI